MDYKKNNMSTDKEKGRGNQRARVRSGLRKNIQGLLMSPLVSPPNVPVRAHLLLLVT
jgi:hypothetical protein